VMKCVITSIGTVTQVSIEFRDKKKENKKIVTNIEYLTKYTYEYDNKRVRIWKKREMQIHIRNIRIITMQIEQGFTYTRRVMRTSTAP